jgi:hypothetical protein
MCLGSRKDLVLENLALRANAGAAPQESTSPAVSSANFVRETQASRKLVFDSLLICICHGLYGIFRKDNRFAHRDAM